jgi:drug/metabolite transporter (DMT)-like permease
MNSKLNDAELVRIDGQRIAYHRCGSGPSAALIHGIPTSSYLWRNVIPRLAGESLEVIAVDLLGYLKGESWPAVATPIQWGWFISLATPASTGSFRLWFIALTKGGATKCSGYLFLAPLFTVILSFFVLGVGLSWLQGAGGLLIGVALWLVNRELPGRSGAERVSEALAEGRP